MATALPWRRFLTSTIDLFRPTRILTSPYTTAFLSVSALSTFIHTSYFEIFTIRGESMQPTLLSAPSRDWVLFWKRYRLSGMRKGTTVLGSQLKRGMVVAFDSLEGEGKVAVKRVVALEGDVVIPWRKSEEQVAREARRANSGELQLVSRAPRVEWQEPITVPLGHVWVEGDNAARSLDSNDYGPISKSLIQGVATSIILPWARRGKTRWEDDGWQKRVKGRVRERERGEVPDEWAIWKDLIEAR